MGEANCIGIWTAVCRCCWNVQRFPHYPWCPPRVRALSVAVHHNDGYYCLWTPKGDVVNASLFRWQSHVQKQSIPQAVLASLVIVSKCMASASRHRMDPCEFGIIYFNGTYFSCMEIFQYHGSMILSDSLSHETTVRKQLGQSGTQWPHLPQWHLAVIGVAAFVDKMRKSSGSAHQWHSRTEGPTVRSQQQRIKGSTETALAWYENHPTTSRLSPWTRKIVIPNQNNEPIIIQDKHWIIYFA